MKRIILFFTIVFCAAALVSAQRDNRRGPNFPPPGGPPPHSWNRELYRNFSPQPENTSISGNLTITQGMISVTDNNITYLVRGLHRYIGFIDGLKEGEAVTFDGYAMPYPQDAKIKLFRAHKMTLNGKNYDLAQPCRNIFPNQMYYQNKMYQKRHWGIW